MPIKQIFITTIFIVNSLWASAAVANVKIGFVDIQKAIQETSAGKSAKGQLESEFNKRKKELETKESDLQKMNEDLEKRAMVLSDDVRAQKQTELQQEIMKYRELVSRSQMEIQQKERDLTMPILEGLRDIIEEIAKKDKYTMIMERSEQNVLWASSEIDLTDRVIKEFEAKNKKKR